MDTFIQWLQHIDRRWIYLALAVGLVIALIVGTPETPKPLQPVVDLYTAINDAKTVEKDNATGQMKRKLVILSLSFGPSTLPENGNQARALMRHLMLLHKPFALLYMGDQQGPILGNTIAQSLAEHYRCKYGTDWISFSYKPGSLAFFTSFPRNIPGEIKTDSVQGKPIKSFPIMDGIESIENVSILVELTASSTVTNWIADVQGKFSLQLGDGCTGVMTAEAYTWLDSKQLVGLMPGMKGADDYETLVDDLEAREIANGHQQHRYDPATFTQLNMKPARVLMFSQGIAHLIIIGFILLGNLGFILSRFSGRKRKGGQQS